MPAELSTEVYPHLPKKLNFNYKYSQFYALKISPPVLVFTETESVPMQTSVIKAY